MNKIIIYHTTLNDNIFYDIFFIKNDVIVQKYFNVKPSDKVNELTEVLSSISQVDDDIFDYFLQQFDNCAKELNKLSSDINDINDKIADKMMYTNTGMKYDIEDAIYKLNVISNNRYSTLDDRIILNNTDVYLPIILCKTINNNSDMEYIKALHLFWLNCLNKDNTSNIEDLFDFIFQNGLTITPNGYLFTFRRIVTKHSSENVALFKFILQTWINNIQQSVPNDDRYIGYDFVTNEYFSTTNPNVSSTSINILGTVSELYDQLKDSDYTIKYTDNHTRTFNYKINHTYIVNDVDNNINNYCSYGLHLGSRKYVKENAWLGDTIVGCIVNPRDIIAVADSLSKLRVRKMHITCIIDDIDTFDVKLFKYDYESVEYNDNIEYVSYKFKEEYCLHNEIQKEINKLNVMKDELENKISHIKNKFEVDNNDVVNYLQKMYKNVQICETD